MKREKMIQYMDLLDEKYIIEADPANAKNIRSKRIRGTILRIGSLAACMAVVLCGIFWLNREPAYTKPQRNIVETFGYIEPMGDMIADVNNYEAITELSSQIVLCEIKDLVDVTVTEIGLFSFRYDIEILDILLDVGDRLQIGDTVQITSSEGILKAVDAAELIADTPRAKKLGILQGEYSDDDYIIASTWDAIPVEVGNCYLMYLDDDYLESEGVYAESGRSYLYEYHDQVVYSGRDMIKNESSLSEILETVSGYISMRTGRADEIGEAAYLLELQDRQIQERYPDIAGKDVLENADDHDLKDITAIAPMTGKWDVFDILGKPALFILLTDEQAATVPYETNPLLYHVNEKGVWMFWSIHEDGWTMDEILEIYGISSADNILQIDITEKNTKEKEKVQVIDSELISEFFRIMQTADVMHRLSWGESHSLQSKDEYDIDTVVYVDILTDHGDIFSLQLYQHADCLVQNGETFYQLKDGEGESLFTLLKGMTAEEFKDSMTDREVQTTEQVFETEEVIIEN